MEHEDTQFIDYDDEGNEFDIRDVVDESEIPRSHTETTAQGVEEVKATGRQRQVYVPKNQGQPPVDDDGFTLVQKRGSKQNKQKGNQPGNQAQNNNPRGRGRGRGRGDRGGHSGGPDTRTQNRKDAKSVQVANNLEKVHKKVDARPVIRLNFPLDEKVQSRIERTFQGFQFETYGGGSPHAHPVTATERLVAEEIMLYKSSKAGSCVVHVFGNVNRHYKYHRSNIWCILPNHTAKMDLDYAHIRNFSAESQVDKLDESQISYCVCEPVSCGHIESNKALAGIADFLFMTYSRNDILQFLHAHVNMRLFYVACRRFKDVKGSMNDGEIAYHRDSDTVYFSMIGSGASYKMPATDWVYNSNYYENNGQAMTWDVCAKVGAASDIVVFTISKPGKDNNDLVPPSDDFFDALMDHAHTGTVSFDLRGTLDKDPVAKTVLTKESVPIVSKTYSLGEWFIFMNQQTMTVYVPKQAIAECRLYCANKVRDAALWQMATTKAKQILQKYNISAKMMADALLIVTSIGFFADLETENRLMAYNLVTHKEELLKQQILAKFQPIRSLSMFWLVGAVMFGVGVAMYTTARVRRARAAVNVSDARKVLKYVPVYEAGNIFTSLWKWLYGAITLGVTGSVYSMLETGTRSLKLFYDFAKMVPITQVEHHHQTIHTPDICNLERKLKEPDETAVIKTSDMVCRPKLGFSLFGIRVNVRRPVISRSCAHNELVAVNNRGCLAQMPVAEMPLFEFTTVVTHLFCRVVEGSEWVVNGRLKPPMFKTWVNRFPPPKRNKLIVARNEMREGNPKVNPRIDAFVKREAVMKSQPLAESQVGTVEPYDPRLISGRSDRYQVCTGPTTYAFTKYVAWLNHPDVSVGKPTIPHDLRPKVSVVYTSGLNAEQLGEWFQFQWDRLSARGKVIIYLCDHVRLDAHVTEEIYEVKNKPYHSLRAPTKAVKCLDRNVTTRGTTKHGVEYEVEATVKSGDGDTSVGDYVIVTGGHECVRAHAKIPKEDHAGAGLGDDSLQMLLEQYFSRHYHLAPRFWAGLGFEIEGHYITNPYDAEYCSGRFYPTNHGLVFGPKPGRVIAKSFHCRLPLNDHEGKRWLKAVCLGLEKSTAFVPVLRVVIRKQLQLLERYTPAHYEYEPEKVVATEWHEITWRTMAMMEHLYDLTPTQVFELEAFIEREVKSLPCTIQHPYLDQIIEHDCPLEETYKSEVKPTRWVTGSLFDGSDPWLLAAGTVTFISPLWLMLPGILRGDDFSDSLLLTTIAGPILEEVAKSRSRWCTLILIAVEAAKCFHQGRLSAYLPWLAIHPILGEIGRRGYNRLALAISLHSWLNASVMFQTYQALNIPILTDYSLRQACNLVISSAGGFAQVLASQWNKFMHMAQGNVENYKGKLLELCAKLGWRTPEFNITEIGSMLNPAFHCITVVKAGVKSYEYSAVGNTKKEAEHAASKMALDELDAARESKFDGANSIAQLVRKQLKWPVIFVDADQGHPKITNLVALAAQKVYIVGNSNNVWAWEAYLKGIPHELIEVYSCVVPAMKNAADDKLIQALNKVRERPALFVTGDKELMRRASQPGVTVVEPTRVLPPNVLAQLQMTPELKEALLKLVGATALYPSSPPMETEVSDFVRW